MSRELIEAERERFSLKEENCYRIEGAWKTGYVPKVYVDKEQVTDISYALSLIHISEPTRPY